MALQSPRVDINQMLATGLRLHQSGQLDQAERVYRQILAVDKRHADTLHLLGVLAHARGDYRAAVQNITKALKQSPKHAGFLTNLGNAYKAMGHMAEAMQAYRHATTAKPPLAEAHYNLGNLLMQNGAYQQALEALQKAVSIKPDFAEAHNVAGIAMFEMRDYEGAVHACRKAIELNPRIPEAYNNLGNALRAQGHTEDALQAFSKALELKPDFADVYSNRAVLYYDRHELEQAREQAEKALSLNPDLAHGRWILAAILRRSGEAEAALDTLREIRLPKTGRLAAEVHQQMGRIYDTLGDADEAFKHFADSNRLMQNLLRVGEGRHSYYQGVQHLREAVKDLPFDSLQAGGANGDEAAPPVFLVGFPRSGTTLLDQILDAHPGVQVLEEKPLLSSVEARLLEMKGDYASGLRELTQEERRELRSVFFATADGYLVRDPQALLVDKLPLNLLYMHLICALFPDARVIFALRHPMDVCLSCFMQAFFVNDAMASFLTLEDTTRLYDLVMSFWQEMTPTLPLPVYTLHYESLVQDFEAQVRGLIDFLGLPWTDDVLAYAQHARGRHIATPSHEQVVQPIYTHARYRWKRYEKQLAPYLGRLERHIRYFGYAGE